jgi:hypothetical protein
LTVRLLLIAERAEYRLLVRKHVEIEWPDVYRRASFGRGQAPWTFISPPPVSMRSSSSARRPPLRLEQLAAELLAKPGVRADRMRTAAGPAAGTAGRWRGCIACYGRKIDRDRLIRTLMTASREHKQMQAVSAQPDFEQRYRFGSVMIRGHRCIRQVGSGGMCKIYLAESERAGTLVVLKVFSQVPDVSNGSSASTDSCRNMKSSPA